MSMTAADQTLETLRRLQDAAIALADAYERTGDDRTLYPLISEFREARAAWEQLSPESMTT